MIISLCSNLQFSGLVPVKKYKGPILKLNKADKRNIANLEKEIAQTECDLYKLNKTYDRRKISESERNYFIDMEHTLYLKIKFLREEIRKIKINRFNIQKEKLK